MTDYCPNFTQCGFFRKYEGTNNLACRGLIRTYCGGPKRNDCQRKTYKQQRGAAPSDDMLPNGSMMAS